MPRWAHRAAWMVLAVVALVPIWSVRWLPLLDLSNHLASAAIWLHHGDPAWGLDEAYRLQISPFPYFLFHAPLVALGHVVPLLTAAKIYISLCVLGLPVAVGYLASSFGRSRDLGLLAFPLSYSWPFAMGWIAWCAGLVAALAALGLFARALDDGSRARLGLLVPAALAAYLLHVLPWVFLGLGAGVVAFTRIGRVPWRRLVVALLALLPSAGLALYEVLAGPGHGVPVGGGGAGFQADFEPVGDIVKATPARLIDISQGHTDEIAVILVGLSVVALLATTGWAGGRPGRPTFVGPRRHTLALVGLLALAVAGVLFLPVEIHTPFHMWQIGSRYLVIAAVLLCALPAGAIVGRRSLALVPGIAAGLVHPLGLVPDYHAFNDAVAGFDEVVAQIPQGTDTLPAAGGDLMAPGGRVRALRMFPQYVQVLRGGYNPYNFSVGFPMAYAKERPAPPWMQQAHPSFIGHGVYYDFVLTFRTEGSSRGTSFTKVAEQGDWTLWKNTGGKRTPRPGHQNPPNR